MNPKAFKANWLCSRCKVLWQMSQKTLHLPLEQSGAPVEIRIVTMSQLHQKGYL